MERGQSLQFVKLIGLYGKNVDTVAANKMDRAASKNSEVSTLPCTDKAVLLCMISDRMCCLKTVHNVCLILQTPRLHYI